MPENKVASRQCIFLGKGFQRLSKQARKGKDVGDYSQQIEHCLFFFFFQNGFKPTRTKSAMQSVDQRCNLHVTVFVNETSATLWLLKSWPRRQAAARWQSPHDSHPIHMKRNSSQRHCEQTLHFKSTLLASRAGAYTCIVTWSCETFTTCPFCTQAVILHATHCVLKWLCVCCMYINVRAVAARTEHLQHKRQEVSPCHKQ